jgi:hypothetical protein
MCASPTTTNWMTTDGASTSVESTTGEPYPFQRTVCACRLCTINCEHMPGALAPADLPRLAAHLGYGDDIDRFANECLLASDGAKLAMRDGRTVSLPTLVPASRDDGACRFLDDASRCTIHAVSPFGCAYIDAHMPDAEFRRRADTLYRLILKDQDEQGVYSRLCAQLRAQGRAAPPLETRRYRLAKALRKEGREAARLD